MTRPGWIDVLAAGFAPGALLGTHVAGLIFFLNPHLPFTAAPVLRGVLLHGALLGLAGLLLHLPFTARRPRRARRALPWTLTLALGTAAWLDAGHASLFAFYLPPGINDRLIRTAVWLGLAALISFYTALLHTLQRRRFGWRSRYGLALLALLSVYAMVERREAFQPRPDPDYRPAVVAAGPRPFLLVTGLDSATLDALLPLAGQGRLPFLATLLQQGAYGRLETFSPTWREALWTTLATGKYPYRHGVKGGRVYGAGWIAPGEELRLLPAGIRFRSWGTLGEEGRRLRSFPRETLALWEVLPRLGVPAGTVGWPASWPASRETAFSISELLLEGAEGREGAWPGDLADRLRLFGPAPDEIDPALRARLGPDPPPWMLQALAGDLRRVEIARALLEQHPRSGALFLTLPGLREVSLRSFGGFHQVQFEAEQAPESRRAAERLSAYAAILDGLLAELWGMKEGPRVLAVVSAHGVRARRDRLGLDSESEGLEGRFGGAPDGTLLLYGEGIEPGALLTGARAVDVAPTLLYALGLPVARDLDGQVLTAAFDKRFLSGHPLTFLPSYEALARTPPAARDAGGS